MPRIGDLEDQEQELATGIEAAPLWTVDNEFLLSGYRRKLSVMEAFKTIMRPHNERANVISHLVSAIVFVGCAMLASGPIRWYCIGAVTCFALSSLFHCLLCVSERVMVILAKGDYIGIATHMVATGYAWSEIMYGNTKISTILQTIDTGAYGALVCYIVVSEGFHQGEFRTKRARIFFAYACIINVGPALTLIVDTSLGQESAVATTEICISLFMYILGVVVYISRVPERFCPRKFDILAPSHAIFHVLVSLGSVWMYFYLKKLITQPLISYR